MLGQANVLCIGDVMLDRYIGGHVARISPESPVPVLNIRNSTTCPGGAANVAKNIAALGSRCTLISVVGQDGPAQELRKLLEDSPAIRCEFVASKRRPTTEKTRYIAQGQQILRTDNETTEDIWATEVNELLSIIGKRVAAHDVMVLSDYAKGVLTPALIQGAIDIAKDSGIAVLVDPKCRDFRRYAGASVLVPSAKDIFEATGVDVLEDDTVVHKTGREVLARANIDHMVITRGHRGLTLVSRRAKTVHLSATAREVFDVVGARDTVIATLAVAIGGGEKLEAASKLANLAAGIVVGKRGTASVSAAELEKSAKYAEDSTLESLERKVLDIDALRHQVEAWHNCEQSVGLAVGRFNGLTEEHIDLFTKAKQACSKLVAVVEDDKSPRLGSSPAKTTSTELARARVVASMENVDAVVIVSRDEIASLCEELNVSLVRMADDLDLQADSRGLPVLPRLKRNFTETAKMLAS